ncbi:rhamnogalacturonan acetylesterase [Massilia terrae]|uniref:Rhamnogalacturonan acetylesterase n=1 Tax=Massilia terrae TaxID=1811224 RepID=A0ABT2CTH2_9BURK|nr:rhamnogalacturonan acetylesterase [Massilia terrae]MCS0657249.1 rhamnogalacturonan acetylesterase [Massilia terrae]
MHPVRQTLAAAVLAAFALSAHAADSYRLAFDKAHAPAGYTVVQPAETYSAERGYGFEPGEKPGGPFYFSVALPEGNYNVTVTLGDDKEPALTTVKAELRRLMLENVATAAGQSVTRTFTVNLRTPQIGAVDHIAAGEVKLKTPRETVKEAWAWDQRLTLEFNGQHPAVRSIEVVPVKTPTLFLLGDSTVCDQPGEPYNSWGQMLPRFLKPGIAVANHGESGETYRDSIGRRRLDKILSVMKPGDTLLMQFGHNDQKQIKAGKGGPFTTYKAEIKTHVDAVRAHGGLPVIVSPMERRGFDAQGKVIPSLAEYAEAARQSAQELGVPFIDLNAKSKVLYEALGPEGSKAAFAEPTPGHLDNTHHDNYGSYELAKLVVTGMQEAKLPAAAFVVDGFAFDPARPDPVASFHVPPSPTPKADRPLGDEDHK